MQAVSYTYVAQDAIFTHNSILIAQTIHNYCVSNHL